MEGKGEAAPATLSYRGGRYVGKACGTGEAESGCRGDEADKAERMSRTAPSQGLGEERGRSGRGNPVLVGDERSVRCALVKGKKKEIES